MKQSYLNGQRHKARPEQYKHDLGQHFLYDRVLLERLVEKTGIEKEQDVLEIGPGEGTLTEVLCEAAGRVTAVEVDSVLIPVLKLMAQRLQNLTILQGDIRKLPFDEITASLHKPFHVIANIPYNITSPILSLLWAHSGDMCRISLMVQKEVAEKLTAQLGQPEYGLAAITAQYYAECEIAEVIPAAAFTPPPKVDSAFIIMKLRQGSKWNVKNEVFFFTLLKAGFSQKRKTLANALKPVVPGSAVLQAMDALGLNPLCRAQELSLPRWVAFSNCLCELQGEAIDG